MKSLYFFATIMVLSLCIGSTKEPKPIPIKKPTEKDSLRLEIKKDLEFIKQYATYKN